MFPQQPHAIGLPGFRVLLVGRADQPALGGQDHLAVQQCLPALEVQVAPGFCSQAANARLSNASDRTAALMIFSQLRKT
jgi:hypothetical protein